SEEGAAGEVPRGPANRARGAAEGAVRPAHAGGDAAAHQQRQAAQRAARDRPREDADSSEGRSQVMAEEQANTEATAAPARKALVQTFIGRVVSDKMAKTVTVLVERRVKHPISGKIAIQPGGFHAPQKKG